jgi:large subunit ribosomal protein L5e
LVVQEKNKYESHRFRFVVRFTNTTVITQIVFSEIDGDKVLAAAYSSELPRYGLAVGLKNYAAAYATGLLLARRTLKKLGMDEDYKGNTNVDGSVFQPEALEERRPFRACLDVGTRATTTGARLFGALKGASDGGLYIPHSEKRFPGYDRASKEYNAEAHKDRIFGKHVADYMIAMKEDDSEKYAKHFSQFIAKGIEGEGLEALYKKVHEVRERQFWCEGVRTQSIWLWV